MMLYLQLMRYGPASTTPRTCVDHDKVFDLEDHYKQPLHQVVGVRTGDLSTVTVHTRAYEKKYVFYLFQEQQTDDCNKIVARVDRLHLGDQELERIL